MSEVIKEAINVLKENDRGGYTVPTNRLYPFQWNWDSVFTAMGLWHFNKWRAWLEIISLLDGQWENGMIPHIIFRQNDPDYFPGPDEWASNNEPPTSCLTQPPVLSSIIWQMVKKGTPYDSKKAKEIFDPNVLSIDYDDVIVDPALIENMLVCLFVSAQQSKLSLHFYF